MQSVMNETSLKSAIEAGLDLKQSLTLSWEIVKILNEIHKNDKIYSILNPFNIFISDGVVTFLEETTTDPTNLSPLYMSPEQTGRMNKTLDYRSDLYSFGVILYEIFSGKPPFSGETEELLYSHVAKVPLLLKKINAEVPEVVSEIIMKLLNKNPEERYQSTHSLLKDLSECLRQFNENGEVKKFSIGVNDHAGKLKISQLVYGRNEELSQLIQAVERARHGGKELTFVAGKAGVGKTSLINELRRAVLGSKGYFVSGKFDQFSNEIPYSAFIQALKKLVLQILSKNAQEIQQWKERFINTLGTNGRLMTDAIPELELIMGKQPVVQLMPPLESKNRFNLAIKEFVKIIAKEEQQLIMFIDDIQWADSDSVELLKMFLADSEVRNILFILTTRDIDAEQVSEITFSLKEKNIQVNRIHLNDLDANFLKSFIDDTFNNTLQNSSSLGDLIFSKTNGNPFFVVEFLKMLEQKDMIQFQPETGWTWDHKLVSQTLITDNVVELLSARLLNTSHELQYFLKAASCLGNSFTIKDLALLVERDKSVLESALIHAIQERLIVREIDNNEKAIYSFIHDRIQKAVYDLVSKEEKEKLHYAIGHQFLRSFKEEKLFFIVNHLNLGKDLIKNDAERKQLAELNLKAGRKAREANAFGFALNYFSSGKNIYNKTLDDKLQFELCVEKAECRFLSGDTLEAEMLFDELLIHIKDPLEKSKILDKKLLLYTSLGEYGKALKTGREALGYLGIKLVTNPVGVKLVIAKQIVKALLFLRKRKAEEIVDLHLMESEKDKQIVAILSNLSTPTFYVSQELYLLTALTLANFSFKNGNSSDSASGYLLFSIALNALFGKYKKTLEIGNAALKLHQKFNNDAVLAKLYAIFYGGIYHWVKPLKASFPFLNEGYKLALQHGDFHYARTLINVNLSLQIRSGKNVAQILFEFLTHKAFMIQDEEAKHLRDEYRVYINYLFLLTSIEADLSIKFDEEKFLSKDQTPFNLAYHYIYRAQYHYLKENLIESIKSSTEATKLLMMIKSTPMESECYFYQALSLSGFYFDSSKSYQKKTIKILRKKVAQFKKFSEVCAENFEHQYLLLKGELARISGDEMNAISHYRDCIVSARRNGFIQIEAIANEILGKLFKSHGHDEIASSYLSKAFYLFYQWGATFKVDDLLTKYPKWLNSASLFNISSPDKLVELQINDLSLLDYEAVMKASQAISEEITPDMLIKKLMRIVMEITGAQRGALFLNHDDDPNEYFLEAEARINEDCKILSLPKTIDKVTNYPVSILNYVSRKQEQLLLNNAQNPQEIFIPDTYLLDNKVKSLLCKPFRKGKDTIGLLYLENNLMEDVFNGNKTGILDSLCAQAAISIQNARMYNKTKVLTNTLEEYNNDLLNEINERKTVEEKLKQKNEELNVFLYKSSHDLRGPLASILGLTNIAANEVKDKATLQYIEMIRKSSLKLDGILLELIAINRMKQTEPVFIELNIIELANEIINSLEFVDAASKIKVIKNISTNFFNSDKTLLKSIIQNLIDNSIKYRNKSIETPFVELTIKEVPEGLKISVKDNGTGINYENQEKVFEMFFRDNPDPNGVGLGLYIVKCAVERLNGKISLTSELGKGSEFQIVLHKNN